ncbi:6145_t:CDS:10 [Cetraspora pellucida]|uniref:6145_t:CDS:1 n=1 Tax=Cetraspora pellucida TaxID=1433469 RepID=A0A9N9NED6_9GLOM|nr:6145_t:CDS:10 [Cetraspora pellucida]
MQRKIYEYSSGLQCKESRVRRSRTGAQYFDEFRTHFWERPEDDFDRFRNINSSTRRQRRIGRNDAPAPSTGEVEHALDQISLRNRRSRRRSVSPSLSRDAINTNTNNPDEAQNNNNSSETNQSHDNSSHEVAVSSRDIILGRVEDANLYSYANVNVVYFDTKQSLLRYDDAFEGLCSLRDIGAVKTNKEKPLSSEQIEKNISELKSKLIQNSSPLYDKMLNSLGDIVVSGLSWKDPIASQVISNDSELVKKSSKKLKRVFMVERCREFASDYNEQQMEILPEKLKHDKSWKEGDKTLIEVTKGILSILSDTWNNLAFSLEFIESQNEGTYVTNIIVPAIHAALKDLPFGKSSYVSTSEKQSIASADRRSEGNFGRRPDHKKINDSVKLRREVNDGIFWTWCELHLNILVRDSGNIHRYFYLKSAKISIQQAEEKDVTELWKLC